MGQCMEERDAAFEISGGALRHRAGWQQTRACRPAGTSGRLRFTQRKRTLRIFACDCEGDLRFGERIGLGESREA
jgi:hypothetical protein